MTLRRRALYEWKWCCKSHIDVYRCHKVTFNGKMDKLEVSEVIVLDLKIFPLQFNIQGLIWRRRVAEKDEKWHVWDFGGFCGGSSNSCLPSSWWVRRQHWTQFRLVQHPNNNFKFSFLLDFSPLICECDRCFDCLWTVVISFWNRDPKSPFPCALADHTS